MYNENGIPTGKLFGLRKHDLIQTDKGTGFVKGKRSSGYFAIENVLGKTITNSVNVKKNKLRLSARSATLIQFMEDGDSSCAKHTGILAKTR